MTKIYAITFIKYTSNIDYSVYSSIHNKYLNTNEGEIIAREDQIDFYRNFGNGIKECIFLGYLYNEPLTEF